MTPDERSVEEEFNWTYVDAISDAFVFDVEALDGFDWEISPVAVSINIVPLVVGGWTQDIIVAGRPLSEVVVAVRVRRLILVAQRKHLARGYVVTI